MKTLEAHRRTEIAAALTATAVLAFSFALHAQQVTVLKNVNVIDGTGTPLQRNATVTVEGELIRSISTGQIQAPSGARVVDMNGQTIMPLIINTHGHRNKNNGQGENAKIICEPA